MLRHCYSIQFYQNSQRKNKHNCKLNKRIKAEYCFSSRLVGSSIRKRPNRHSRSTTPKHARNFQLWFVCVGSWEERITALSSQPRLLNSFEVQESTLDANVTFPKARRSVGPRFPCRPVCLPSIVVCNQSGFRDRSHPLSRRDDDNKCVEGL